MRSLRYSFKNFKKDRLVNYFVGIYFYLIILTCYAILNRDVKVVEYLELLFMPILLMVYLSKTKKSNTFFIFLLGLVWISQIFSGSSSIMFAFLSLVFLLIYKGFILSFINFRKYLDFGISSIPFIGLYLIIAYLSYNGVKGEFYLFLTQGLFIIIFGGVSLAKYIKNPGRTNTNLLRCSALIIGSQAVLELKSVFFSENLLQSVSTILFAVGQYELMRYVILSESKIKTVRRNRAIKTASLTSEPEMDASNVKVLKLNKNIEIPRQEDNLKRVYHLNKNATEE